MANNNKVVRNELNKYAQQIENLAKQVQETLAQDGDPLALAHELFRNSSTFVFTLGEMVALEGRAALPTATKQLQATVVSNPNNTVTTTPRNRHNVRDSLGRFARV